MTYKSFIVSSNTLGLKYCDSDAERLAQLLESFNYENIRPVCQKREILADFDSFLDSLTATDTALLYFSGHAILERGELILILADDLSKKSSKISIGAMLSEFSDSPGGRKIVFLDCCHAQKSTVDLVVDFSDKFIVFCSSGKLERSKEIEFLNAGFFTYVLCTALESFKQKYIGQSLEPAVKELGEYFSNEAKNFNSINELQVPIPVTYGSHSNFNIVDVNLIVTSALTSKNFENKENEAALKYYCDLLLKSCDIMSLANLPEQDRHLALRPLELRRLYVPLRVWADFASGDDAKESDWDEIERRRLAGMSGHSISVQTQEKTERAPVGERLAQSRRLVVLGDPGAGKTTLLRWIATAYLLKLRSDEAWHELPDISSLPYQNWLPILVRCRELSQECLNGTLDDILYHTLRKSEIAPVHLERLQKILRERLENGTAILMIDGLDEITDPAQRSFFCSQLERIHLAHPQAAIIITSRIVGYRELAARLGRGFEHVTLADLLPEEKDDFAARWCSLTEPPDRLKSVTLGLTKDIHSSDRIERMTGNPMLLTTMALVRRKVGKLPSRRAELYGEAVQVLLNWRSEVGEHLDSYEAIPQLQYIAYFMCHKGIKRLPRSVLLNLIIEMRAEYPNLHQITTHSPEEFLKCMESSAGLIIESGREKIAGFDELVYEFRHLTFQEFLAAGALVHGKFPNRIPSSTLAQNVATLASKTTEDAFTEGGTKEVVVVESWREALRLVATMCQDDDLHDFLDAVVTVLPGESNTVGRARAILAVLCIADEPNVSKEMADKLFCNFVKFIDERDRNLEIKTGIHFAAMAISESRWAQRLVHFLVDQFLTLPALRRDYCGDIAGLVIAKSISDADMETWWALQPTALKSVQEFDIAYSALGMAALSVEKNKIFINHELVVNLLSLLHASPAISHAASQALSNINSMAENFAWEPSAIQIEEILQFLSDPGRDPETIRFLINILSGSCKDELLSYLDFWSKHSSEDLRRAIVLALCANGGQAAFNILWGLRKDQSAAVRSTMLTEMVLFSDEKAIEIIVEGLNDSSEEINSNAIFLAGRMKDKRASSYILPFLKSNNKELVVDAIFSLSMIADESVVPNLIDLVDEENEDVCNSVFRAIGEIKAKNFSENIFKFLRSTDLNIRCEACRALGRIGDVKAVPYILEIVEEFDPSTRFAAIHALGLLKDVRCLDALFSALVDEDEQIREMAAESIGNFGTDDVVERLENILASMNNFKICEVLDALGVIGNEASVPKILPWLEDEDELMKNSAILALGRIGGPEAEDAIYQMFDLPRQRRFVIAALGKIGSKKAFEKISLVISSEKSGDDRYLAIEALRNVNLDLSRELLSQLLTSDLRLDRSAAVRALSSELGETEKILLSEDLDGRWPWIDPLSVISKSRVTYIAKYLRMPTNEIISLYEGLEEKFNLRLSWSEGERSLIASKAV